MFFNFVEILFPIFFLFIMGVFIFSFVKGISTWNKNNHSPRLNVAARIVSKRTHTSHHQTNDMHMSTSSTTYYVTFQVESGDRMEFKVSGSEYGMLAEGDQGTLSFQGTRYLSFQRAY